MKHKQVQLRRLFSSSIGGSWGGPPEDGDVVLPCVRGTDLDFRRLRVKPDSAPLRSYTSQEVAYRAASQGDIIIEKSGGGDKQPVGRIALWDRCEPVMPTNFAGRLRPSPGHEPRYLAYLLAALYYEGRTVAAIKQTTGIQNLDLHAFLSTRVQLLELPIQRAIADYLDIETGRIDALITKKRRMIELLRNRWEEFIEIQLPAPRGIRFKRLLRAPLAYGVLVPRHDPAGVPMLRVSDFVTGSVDLDSVARIPVSLSDEYRRTIVREGDLIVSIVGTLGRAAVIGPLLAGCNLSRALARVQLAMTIPKDLIRIWMGSRQFRVQAELATASASAQPALNLGDMKNFVIGVEPQSDWNGLGTRLLDQERRTTSIVDALRRQVNLLTERRQALITAAVTGELAVPGAAA